jgi:hypothetical protein
MTRHPFTVRWGGSLPTSYYSDASLVAGSANLGMQPTAFGRG